MLDNLFHALILTVPALTAVFAVLVSTGWAAVTGVLGSLALSCLAYLKARSIAAIGANATVKAAETAAAAATRSAETAGEAAAQAANTAASAALHNHSWSVLVSSVTAERATWRRELRTATIELATQLRLSADLEPLNRIAVTTQFLGSASALTRMASTLIN